MHLKSKPRLFIVLCLILLVAVAALVWFGQRQRKNQEHYYSGTIEAIQANLSFQAAGRVAQVQAD